MRDRDAIYQDIIRCGRRRAENAWLRGDAALAKVEKAHLAVIPGLLHCSDERRHRHYLEFERHRFLRNCKHRATSDFAPFWEELSGEFPPTAAPKPPPDIPMANLAGPVVLNYRGRPGRS